MPYDCSDRGLGVGHVEACGSARFTISRALREVRTRHVREQVVLDLVVEAAAERRRPPAAADVARGEHLLREEVDLRVGRDDRHALVVRRERGAHVDAEDGQLHADEGERHAERQHQKIDAEVDAKRSGDEAELEPAALDRPAVEQGADRGDVQVDALERAAAGRTGSPGCA